MYTRKQIDRCYNMAMTDNTPMSFGIFNYWINAAIAMERANEQADDTKTA